MSDSFKNPLNKLILGTVQFGLNYGINNSSGKPSQKTVFEILDAASEENIESLDTADAYGNAIEQIGQYHRKCKHRFKILSKFKYVPQSNLYDQVQTSLDKLEITTFDTYSYHSFSDYLNFPFLKKELESLKKQGLVEKIGVSVYANAELRQVISDENIDVIQLPYNLLDNQNVRGPYMEEAKLKNKEIHIRSVFLQGLLFMNENSIPEKLAPLNPYLQSIHTYCKNQSIDVSSLALSYAIYNRNVDRILIGVDDKDQLVRNIKSIRDLNQGFEFINNNITVDETEFLNPVNWK